MSQTPFDPVAQWQQVVSKWEQEINSWSGKLTESEQFSAMMGQATKVQVVAQRAFAEQMETLLKNLNLPSKAQVEALSERLDGLEDSIDRVRLAIEALAGKAAAVPAPAEPRRTKQPPKAPQKAKA
jgi:SMC interacting uncharacterized protein involved in chromosome segregation